MEFHLLQISDRAAECRRHSDPKSWNSGKSKFRSDFMSAQFYLKLSLFTDSFVKEKHFFCSARLYVFNTYLIFLFFFKLNTPTFFLQQLMERHAPSCGLFFYWLTDSGEATVTALALRIPVKTFFWACQQWSDCPSPALIHSLQTSHSEWAPHWSILFFYVHRANRKSGQEWEWGTTFPVWMFWILLSHKQSWMFVDVHVPVACKQTQKIQTNYAQFNITGSKANTEGQLYYNITIRPPRQSYNCSSSRHR